MCDDAAQSSRSLRGKFLLSQKPDPALRRDNDTNHFFRIGLNESDFGAFFEKMAQAQIKKYTNSKNLGLSKIPNFCGFCCFVPMGPEIIKIIFEKTLDFFGISAHTMRAF